MEPGSDMESIYQSFDNTRLKRAIEFVLSVLFPVRNGNTKAACHRSWWADYEAPNESSLDPQRPLEDRETWAMNTKEETLESPQQRRSRAFMSLDERDVERRADAAERQTTERNYGRADITRLPGEDLEPSSNHNEADSLGTQLADEARS